MRAPRYDGPAHRFISWNVAGVRALLRKDARVLKQLVERELVDAVCIQVRSVAWRGVACVFVCLCGRFPVVCQQYLCVCVVRRWACVCVRCAHLWTARLSCAAARYAFVRRLVHRSTSCRRPTCRRW